MRFVPITALLIIMAARTARAQTQYEDLDPHRPVAVQDAYAIDRYAFELQLGPAVVVTSAAIASAGRAIVSTLKP